MDRVASSGQCGRVAALRAVAGSGTVIGNLSDGATLIFASRAPSIATLVTSRPSLIGKLRVSLAGGADPFSAIERAFAEYLDEEKRLGRITPGADTATLAFTLFGALHHLFVTRGMDALDRDRVLPIVETVIAGALPREPS
jgi:hypothetical protein